MSGPYHDHILGPYRPAARIERHGLAELVTGTKIIPWPIAGTLLLHVNDTSNKRADCNRDRKRRITAQLFFQDEAKKGVGH